MAIGVLMTPREIAERLGVKVNVVRDLIEQTPDVRPAAFADAIPVFDRGVVARLRYELHKRTAQDMEAQRNE